MVEEEDDELAQEQQEEQEEQKIISVEDDRMLLYYKAPRLRMESVFGKFAPNEAVCKDGWFTSVVYRSIVMGAFLDKSNRHNDTGSPQEVGVGVESSLVPIN